MSQREIADFAYNVLRLCVDIIVCRCYTTERGVNAPTCACRNRASTTRNVATLRTTRTSASVPMVSMATCVNT